MKHKIHRINLLVLLLIVFTTVTASGAVSAATSKPAAKAIRVYVGGKEIHPHAAAVIQNGRVYIEFRSVVQALGFKYKYDAANKLITADSEDASFKIDLKTKKTYVNNSLFTYDLNVPMILGSGADTLVMISLFSGTDYINADYDKTQKIVKVYEDLQGKPKKADLKKIRALVEAHYQTQAGYVAINKLEMESWGTYTMMLADVSVRRTGAELLDRVEHTAIKMEHKPDASWVIHSIEITDVDYLNYTSLAQKEVSVPDADKIAIYALLAAEFKAINDENIDAQLALQNPSSMMIEDEQDLRDYLEITYQKYEMEITKELAVIVSYAPDKAIVYTVYTLSDNDDPSLFKVRFNKLEPVVKGVDGNWYLNPDEEVTLGSEVVK